MCIFISFAVCSASYTDFNFDTGGDSFTNKFLDVLKLFNYLCFRMSALLIDQYLA